jgi:Zn-finger protein
MDIERFFAQFEDHLAPKLDTYEQAIYLYIFRHTRFIGKDDAVIGFKSARTRMACGVGAKGTPMSENSAYEKLMSLASKGCVKIIATERAGRRIHLNLPDEVPGMIPEPTKEAVPHSIDVLDFFEVPENRLAILGREDHRCFYCLCPVNDDTYVIEHVVSRPAGSNSYKNVVAACRQCNNRKGNSSAEDFLRTLYREGVLSQTELQDRMSRLERLRTGALKPTLSA